MVVFYCLLWILAWTTCSRPVQAWTTTTVKQNALPVAVAHHRTARSGRRRTGQSYYYRLSSTSSASTIGKNDTATLTGQNCLAWDAAVQRVKFEEGLDVSEIQKRLVQKGMNYFYSNKPRSNNLNTSTEVNVTTPTLSSEWQRVPGCTASVEIQTTISNLNSSVISVQGTADAHVSRGLLALVCDLLEGLSTETVMSLPIKHGDGELAEILGISRA